MTPVEMAEKITKLLKKNKMLLYHEDNDCYMVTVDRVPKYDKNGDEIYDDDMYGTIWWDRYGKGYDNR